MKMNRKLTILLMVLGFFAGSLQAENGPFTLQVESGWILPGYNTVEIPRDTGTRISLSDDLGIDSEFYFRLRLSFRLAPRQELSVLYAPLSLNARGDLPGPVHFEGVLFPSGTAVDALYRFNSYRLTYRYRVIRSERLDLWVGFTAKIRDAEISITSPLLESSKTNVGFVPLLHWLLDWKAGEKWGIWFEGDALAAPQGRAEDITLAGYYQVGTGLRIRAGYRMVEGGANVDETYNFALIHYLYAGFDWQF